MMDYSEFLKNKMAISQKAGFEIDQSEINPLLFPHQKDIVQWALLGGRRAIFAAFGLGKSFMQLECLHIIGEKEGGKQLVIAPLGVRQEFKIDAVKLGIEIKFIRWTKDLDGPGIYITNYESVRDGRLDVNEFNGVSLDEASVLRSYGSKTFQNFLTLFQSVKYRFVATATPSPNRYKELIHYGGFLGVMDTGAALTRFFKRDSTQANNLTIHPHKEKEFWLWLSTWAIFLQKPSDLGYSDEGYDLPELKIHYHEVQAGDIDRIDKRDGQRLMFGDAALSLQSAASEKRNSLDNRINEMMKIITDNPGDHFIIWHDLENERHAIKKAVPECLEVFGSQDLDKREQRIIDFSDGKFKYLATKPSLSGSGCNFQRHSHKSIFLGIGFKFNDFIQSIHRQYRFLQEHVVDIHLIYASSEIRILEILKEKWKNHDKMVAKMTKIIKKYGLAHTGIEGELMRSMGIKRTEVCGENFQVANNDCVDETKLIESNSVGLIHTSIPFSNHYEYTPSYNDFGHTENNDHFWKQMDYLTPELLRILQPGRIYACHVKDRILFGNVTGKGMPTISPFHMEATFHTMGHGFDYIGMITVVTDVVRENNQTYRLGWTEQCKDGSKMGVGSPEYVLLFRKPQTDRTKGYADVHIKKTKEDYTRARWQIDAHAFWRSSGDRLLDSEELSKLPTDVFVKKFKDYDQETIYNYDNHVKIGEGVDERGKLPATFMSIAPTSDHPEVWTDINRMLTLNSSQKRRNQTLHICPLQFDIVDRIITRYSNKDDLVYDPFAGIGTVPLRALKLGRRGRGSELNPESFKDSVKYLEAEERKKEIPSLFNYIKKQEAIA
jgi:DNA modification methylase